jgi:5-methylcytosine-specific restriction endonuclease McrA
VTTDVPTLAHGQRAPAAWLRAKYHDEGLSCVDIGRLVQRDPKTIHLWMRDAGIPTRPRGSDVRQHFVKGQRSAHAGRRHTPEARAKIRAATIARGGVPYLKNGVHHLKGKRGPATPNWKGGVTPERQAVQRTPEWKAAVRALWRRADAHCERCRADFRVVRKQNGRAFHAHHLLTFAVRATRLDLANLVLLCHGCHNWVHSDANAARWYLAEPLPGLVPGTAVAKSSAPVDAGEAAE